MKTLMIILSALLVSVSVSAETFSQKIANHMVAVLQSTELTELLSQEDGIGNIQSIKYIQTGRATFGPSVYEVSFDSNGIPVHQICVVRVQINILTSEIRNISKPVCQ